MPHLQASWNAPPPLRHTWLSTRIPVLNPHGEKAIQDPVPLRMSELTFTLESGSLNGCPPQEILVVEVIHGIVEIRVTLPIQTVDDTRVPGVRLDDVGTGVRVPSLVSARNGHLSKLIGVLGNARHSNEKMRGWLRLCVLEDERMMSCRPRTPPFIRLSQTRTRHHCCHQSPCQHKWCHSIYFPIGCSHVLSSVSLTIMVSLSFLFFHWLFSRSAVPSLS